MANKFKKSVQERLEKEAVRQKLRTKETTEDQSVTDSNPLEHAQPVQPEPEDQPIAEAASQSTPDIGDYLILKRQRIAKNKTFYLDGDVIEAVKSTARSQNVTDSKLVNDILRRVLGLK